MKLSAQLAQLKQERERKRPPAARPRPAGRPWTGRHWAWVALGLLLVGGGTWAVLHWVVWDRVPAALVGPRVVAKGLVTVARTGQVQGRTVCHPAQLGGVMVVLPGDRIAWRRMARDAGDNAEPDEILREARGALATGTP